MAEAIVSVLMEQLGFIIQQELEQEVKLVVGVGKEVANLTTTLCIIKPVLEDAEENQFKNEAVKFWLAELKDILYDADDVLDEWNTKNFIAPHVRGVISDRSSNAKKVFSYIFSPCSCFKPVYVHSDNASRIKTIREKLDVLALNKDQFNLNGSNVHEETRLVISYVVNVSKIYGRDLDKGIILSKLVGETSSREMYMSVPVICIVGMGGYGKTALAQLVFEEETLITTFQLKMWVCVSEHYDLKRVAKEIIVQATGQVPDDVGWEDLRKRLCNTIKGKQFLLVLDNVWTEDYNDWNPLKLCLDAGALGSRILVTTRNEKVAEMMDSIYRHRLGPLSDEDCWSLLRQRICLRRSAQELGKFEDIGKEIAKKCKGVPLAAKMLASLLWFKRTKQDWKNVLASEIWAMQQVQNILPALLLSYCALPSYLKRCFMYCAIVPKDTKIDKDKMVKLWMAQGFLGCDGRKELEMIGRDYFDDLATRSFFQDFEEDGDGNITACKMHDLVHDLSQFLTTTECLNVARFSSNEASQIHAPVIKSPYIDKAIYLRTLIVKSSTVALPELFHQQTCLRALDLSHSDLKELPREVDRLIHLRLLDLSCTHLKDLPETVSNLYNLQILNLNHCRHLCKLPEQIGELSNLRHLEIEGTYALKFIPKGIGRLTRLQTLRKFIIGATCGGCTVAELRNLNFLTGDLQIIGLRQVQNVNDVKQAELQNKNNLRSLNLDFGYILQENENVGEDNLRKMEYVLESLQPHKNLENLRIVRYPGSVFPSWISSNSLLSNIVTLKLFGCIRCTQLPTLGELESLESLAIENMESVKYIGPEFYGTRVDSNDDGENEIIAFPKLKKLEFVDMKEFEDWQFPFCVYKQIMPRLCDLTLKSCPKLIGLPSLGKLESLESMSMWGLSSLKRLGNEFFGISDNDFYERTGGGASMQQKTIFPRLKELKFVDMEELEEWNFPFGKDREIMPHLRCLELRCCIKLKVLPPLGKLQSLETLNLHELRTIQHLGVELLGISNCDVENGEVAPMVVFPKLRYLTLEIMPEWEEHNDIMGKHTGAAIMPSLHTLEIAWCRKLKAVPHYMVPHTLKYLYLTDCPQLTGKQPYLPQLLEELILDRDVGVLSRSLPINSNNSYPKLKYFAIHSSPWTSLPEGFEKLTSLQELHIFFCKIMDFKTEELEHLASLRKLEISDCPVLTERCKEDWSILSHVPDIITGLHLGG